MSLELHLFVRAGVSLYPSSSDLVGLFNSDGHII